MALPRQRTASDCIQKVVIRLAFITLVEMLVCDLNISNVNVAINHSR